MPNAENYVPGNKISILLKGPFGSGKTIAALSAASEGLVWWAYWDKNEPNELAYYKRLYPELMKNIDYDIYSSHNANQYLNKLFELQRHCKYSTMINDSITMMTAAAVNWSIGFRDPKGPKKDKLNNSATLTIPGMDDYKTETSFVTQALDICKGLPCNVIWTAHPIQSLDVKGGADTGEAMRINQKVSIVSYGNKVGQLAPGQFTEIYHFASVNEWNPAIGRGVQKRKIFTEGFGDDFAKTALNLPKEIDITDKLFWPVWKDAVKLANQKG